MLLVWIVDIILILVVVDMASGGIHDKPIKDEDSSISKEETKKPKNKKKDRSTSSSSGQKQSTSDSRDEGDSLLASITSSDTSDDKWKNKYQPKSSSERNGWRKWHRKCSSCPDRVKKWRDPSIPWVCGAYQRARRSFKSSCMMHYRNCQDGTMFVKIHDGRCANDTGTKRYHGDHFFYEYKVHVSGDDSGTSSSSTDNQEEDSFSW